MKKYIGLATILSLAAGLYLWDVAKIPPAVYADEATVGYNAWQLLVSGRDEYGELFPVLFRFFGAYTPGMMVYLLVPVIELLGLTAFAVRLPSMIFGWLSIVVVYAFLRQSLKRKKALMGAAFYAILPWTVFSSRLGYEVTSGHLLYAVGMYFGWRGLKENDFLKWAALALSMSSYAAHVQRYLLPFAVGLLMLLLSSKRKTEVNKRSLLAAAAVLVICQAPNIYLAFSHPGFWIKNDAISKNVATAGENFIRQYLTYLSPKTIFEQSPDIDKQHQIPGLSLAYWWMVWPFAVGMWGLIKTHKEARSKFVTGLLLISIIPAAFSGVFISTQRAMPMLLPLGLILGIGIARINRPKIMIILAVYSLILLWRGYFVLLPKLNARAWDYGYKETAELIRQNPQTSFVFDNSRNERAYMLIWFWIGKTNNVEFRPIVWKTDPCREQMLIGDTLAVSSGQAEEHKLTRAGEVKDPLGDAIFVWYKTNPKEKCGKIGL